MPHKRIQVRVTRREAGRSPADLLAVHDKRRPPTIIEGSEITNDRPLPQQDKREGLPQDAHIPPPMFVPELWSPQEEYHPIPAGEDGAQQSERETKVTPPVSDPKPVQSRPAQVGMAGGRERAVDTGIPEDQDFVPDESSTPASELPPPAQAPALRMPAPRMIIGSENPFNEEEPTKTGVHIPKPPTPHTPPAKPSLFQKMRNGLLGLFGMGVTAGAAYGAFEATEPVREKVADAAHDAVEDTKQALEAKKQELAASSKRLARIAEGTVQAGSFSGFAQNEMARGTYGADYSVDIPSPEPKRVEQAPTLHKYTVTPNDTLWGIADHIIQENGLEDNDGLLTLQTVKALRDANHIEGDPARSKKMWVGSELDLGPAYDLVQSYAYADNLVSAVEPKEDPATHASSSANQNRSSTLNTTAPDAPALDSSTSPDLQAQFSPELLSPSLNHSGETVFSRAHNMLTHIDVKPNVARSAVLSAIVLKDSHKTEAEAMRIKYAGHKKFNAAKDTLDFTRAAQAALDLKAGMSPGDVAKKYSVADVYSKLRER